MKRMIKRAYYLNYWGLTLLSFYRSSVIKKLYILILENLFFSWFCQKISSFWLSRKSWLQSGWAEWLLDPFYPRFSICKFPFFTGSSGQSTSAAGWAIIRYLFIHEIFITPCNNLLPGCWKTRPMSLRATSAFRAGLAMTNPDFFSTLLIKSVRERSARFSEKTLKCGLYFAARIVNWEAELGQAPPGLHGGGLPSRSGGSGGRAEPPAIPQFNKMAPP